MEETFGKETDSRSQIENLLDSIEGHDIVIIRKGGMTDGCFIPITHCLVRITSNSYIIKDEDENNHISLDKSLIAEVKDGIYSGEFYIYDKLGNAIGIQPA